MNKNLSEELPIIFIDVDDTLKPCGQNISSVNINAVKNYKEHGGEVVIATGKLYSSISHIIDSLNLNDSPQICLNGSVLVNNGKISLIDKLGSVSKEILEILNVLNLKVITYYSDKIVYNNNLIDSNCFELLSQVEETNYSYSDTIDYEDVVKILIFLESSETETENLIKDALKSFKDIIIVRTGHNFFEITNKNTSKGNAAKKVIKDNFLGSVKTVALGDSENDISMLNIADESYIVENAHIKLKNLNKFKIVPSSKDDGAAYLINNILKGVN